MKKRILILVLVMGLAGAFLVTAGWMMGGCTGQIPPLSVMAVTPAVTPTP